MTREEMEKLIEAVRDDPADERANLLADEIEVRWTECADWRKKFLDDNNLIVNREIILRDGLTIVRDGQIIADATD